MQYILYDGNSSERGSLNEDEDVDIPHAGSVEIDLDDGRRIELWTNGDAGVRLVREKTMRDEPVDTPEPK